MTKGSIPEAPDGGHSSQVGTLLDATPVALPCDPVELAEEARGSVRRKLECPQRRDFRPAARPRRP